MRARNADRRALTGPHDEGTGAASSRPLAHLALWARDLASRIEDVRASVGRLVGFVPAERVTVVVEDPYSTANGSAWPFLDRPGLLLWPVPPEPQIAIGNYREWGEMLAVHEFAHLAHLTRPSRNPRDRRLWQLLTVNLGPVARNAPPWVFE